MNKHDQVGIFGLNYENNLENFYISAFKKLKYKNIKFFKNLEIDISSTELRNKIINGS